MLSGFCPASFGVLFCSLVFGCTLNYRTVQWCPVYNWVYVWVWHCSSSTVAVLCLLYKIRCNPVHPLNGALPGPYVPVRLHAVLWLHISMLIRSRLIRSCSPRIRCCRTGGFQEQGQCFFIGLSCSMPTIVSSTIFPFLFFLYIGWYCGAGVFGLIGCTSLSLSLALPTSFNNNNYYSYI